LDLVALAVFVSEESSVTVSATLFGTDHHAFTAVWILTNWEHHLVSSGGIAGTVRPWAHIVVFACLTTAVAPCLISETSMGTSFLTLLTRSALGSSNSGFTIPVHLVIDASP